MENKYRTKHTIYRFLVKCKVLAHIQYRAGRLGDSEINSERRFGLGVSVWKVLKVSNSTLFELSSIYGDADIIMSSKSSK